MIRFRFREWMRYRRAARSRHGVHSPFVFHLIEQALRPPVDRFPALPPEIAEQVPQREDELLRRLFFYFRPKEWLHFPDGQKLQTHALRMNGKTEQSALPFRRMIYLSASAAGWRSLVDDVDFRLHEDDILIVSQPHRNPEWLAHWEEMKALSGCTLSLDFLRSGVLIFKKEFKELQHLALKFPG